MHHNIMSSKFIFLLFCGLFLALVDVDANPVEKPTLRGVTIVATPYVGYENGTFNGFLVDLLNKISEKAGFDYQLYLTPDGKYGILSDNGTVNGMLGEVNQKNADFALADITITDFRKLFVDFTKPFQVVHLEMVINKVHATGMTTFEDVVNYNQQLEDKSAQIAIGVLRGGSVNAVLSTTNDTVGKSLYEIANRDQANFVPTANDGVQRAKESKFGMIMGSAAAEYNVNNACNLTALHDNRDLVKYEYALALQKGSKWLEPFNRAIQELTDDGSIEKLRKNYWVNRCA